ncbi:hypothetical protein H9P43_002070 [Blastocladiella emersonii ATCC 22665]|nr:hypothetical protein H9P43_002070 [Blastocladiella emersonii ATCC 22665]
MTSTAPPAASALARSREGTADGAAAAPFATVTRARSSSRAADRVHESQLDAFERKLRTKREPRGASPDATAAAAAVTPAPLPEAHGSGNTASSRDSIARREPAAAVADPMAAEIAAAMPRFSWRSSTVARPAPVAEPVPETPAPPLLPDEPARATSTGDLSAPPAPVKNYTTKPLPLHRATLIQRDVEEEPSNATPPPAAAAAAAPAPLRIAPVRTDTLTTLPVAGGGDLAANTSTLISQTLNRGESAPMATLSRGMRTFMDRVAAPFVATTEAVVLHPRNTATALAAMAISDDAATASARKTLSAIQGLYARTEDAIGQYREAVYALIEAEAALADAFIEESEAARDQGPGVVDGAVADALAEYGRGLQAQALDSVAYARAVDRFAGSLRTFSSYALADAIDTQRRAEAVHTEIELYRASGLHHLAAVNQQIASQLSRAGTNLVNAPLQMLQAPAANLAAIPGAISAAWPFNRSNSGVAVDAVKEEAATGKASGSGSGSGPTFASADSPSSGGGGETGPSSLTESPTEADGPEPATTVATVAKPTTASSPPTSLHQLAPADPADSLTGSSSSGSGPRAATTRFDVDPHAQALRERHAKLASALAAKARVLQDKALADLTAQMASLRRAAGPAGTGMLASPAVGTAPAAPWSMPVPVLGGGEAKQGGGGDTV